jgi:hypothetical protein
MDAGPQEGRAESGISPPRIPAAAMGVLCAAGPVGHGRIELHWCNMLRDPRHSVALVR